MSIIKGLLVAGAAMLMAACGYTPSMSKDFGVSVGINTASQTMDPNASSRDMIPPTLDGIKAEKAMDRYRKDRPDESRAKLVQSSSNSSN